MIALLCALVSGVLFFLSQGLFDVWWMAWIAPVPILWLAYGDCPRWPLFAAAFFGFAAGQGYMVQAYAGTLPWPAIVLMMLGFGALFGFAVGRARAVQRRLPPAAALFAFPAIWTAIEFLYSLVSPHGTFGSIAYSQVSFPAAIQIAALTGLYGVTFLLCLFANALALLVRGARETGAMGLMVCALALAFGVAQLETPQLSAIRVAALADQAAWRAAPRKPDRDAGAAMARAYADAARAQAAKGARLIVIPESALLLDPRWRDAVTQPLAEVARQMRATIVVGTVMVKPWRNVALAFQPDGTIASYDKRHLLPPFEDKFRPGTTPGLLGRGRAVAICKDLDFPRTIRADARAAATLSAGGPQGIRVIAVPANDFTKDDWIHARMAVMRGVENGFAVVRAAFNGLLTVSDSQGRVIARAETTGKGMTAIFAAVEPGGGPTLYTQVGDMFAWFCTALALGLALLSEVKARGHRHAQCNNE